MVFAVVTGGGTSGHVIPAIAVIEALEDAGHPVGSLAYVGSRRGVESSLVPATGVRCEFLPVSGLQRSFSLRSMLRNAVFPLRLLRSASIARRLARELDPRVVVSVGGYASAPMARAAVSLGIPLVCVSYDAFPGLATRRQSRHAAACAVAFADSDLPNAVVTGAPVRRAVRTMDRASARGAARRSMGIDDGTLLVTVVGGSLGSGALNGAVPALARALSASGVRARIHHVTGPRNASVDEAAGATTGVPGVETVTVAVEKDMPGVLAATDVLVSRAGASTVAEIAAVGVASVLVPWPGAAANHQASNARWLADAGAAVLVEESGALAGHLAERVVALALDADLRGRLADAAHGLGALNRGGSLVELVEKAARAH